MSVNKHLRHCALQVHDWRVLERKRYLTYKIVLKYGSKGSSSFEITVRDVSVRLYIGNKLADRKRKKLTQSHFSRI